MKSEFVMNVSKKEPALIMLGAQLAGGIFSPEITMIVDHKRTSAPKNLGMVEIDEDGVWYPCEYRIKGIMHMTFEQEEFLKEIINGGD